MFVKVVRTKAGQVYVYVLHPLSSNSLRLIYIDCSLEACVSNFNFVFILTKRDILRSFLYNLNLIRVNSTNIQCLHVCLWNYITVD